VSDPTIHIYEQRAHDWERRRSASTTDHAVDFARDVRDGDPQSIVADLGCGPGWYAHDLAAGPVLALDAARAMLDLVPARAPDAWRVQADLRALPLRAGALGAAFASKSYVHLPRVEVPLALADLHRSVRVGGLVELVFFAGDLEHGPLPDDEFSGRRFSLWPEALVRGVVEGAGFEIESPTTNTESDVARNYRIRARRVRTLPDFVTADMTMLCVGLNPSIYSADRGVGFARPGNRFWPAALAAGIVTRDRDGAHAVRVHGVGMTDMVKRATARADELDPDEYRFGFKRLERLVSWLQPHVVCIVGLGGWRAAVSRKAVAGRQPDDLAGVPVYVMPNTSGLNARTPLTALTDHLRAARALAG
jgi:TDG/mug DNA glycosylase family protein